MTSDIGYAVLGIAQEPKGKTRAAVELLIFPDRDAAEVALWRLRANKRTPRILRETAVVVAWNRKGA